MIHRGNILSPSGKASLISCGKLILCGATRRKFAIMRVIPAFLGLKFFKYGVSEFGVSDSPCNTSTKNECGVNLHYVKVGLSRRVRGA